ncbi:MAG: hydantoinase/oxoprolinase family protein [Rhodobiaceae bacterium]|nr:hydantoinase/oxoprolinase family protein [Rhodobiaceae bacterium]MCC0048622.1 hydantoinase/oxoprolinase family protein [Rhodobiaceae bacterium]
MTMAACRVGIDVGGTFTDFVLVNTETGNLTFFKEPSVPSDPSASVERGLPKLVEKAGVTPADVEYIIHGTTLGLNAIIQRRGAKVAMVVTRGFRDLLEIGRSRMPDSYDQRASKEESLVPRDLVFELDARVGAEGDILAQPSEADLDRLAEDLAATGCAAVAVVLLNSYLHPEIERQVTEGLRRRLPEVILTGSSGIWPEIREYERSLIAVLNAYVNPLMDSYFTKLKTRLETVGVRGQIYITASNGGTLSLATANDRPIETLLSGPASGVTAAQFIAARSGQDRVITFDMGGTSSDMAVCKGSEPESTTRTHIADFPLVMPVVNVSAIGAGGGSIVWVDKYGVLKVGPESAGADPGPVCYGRGGTRPTVTDCYVATGLIDPSRFLGGRMQLDRDAALAALAELAPRLGMATGTDIAEAALRVATALMTTELRKSMAQRGEDPRDFAIMPFGGAGPTHANMLAEDAGIRRMLVPTIPGTFCAMGATRANVKRDYVRSLRHTITSPSESDVLLEAALNELREKGAEWISGEGSGLGTPLISASADMRYAGQAFDLPVPIDTSAPVRASDLCEGFHRAHEALYGFRDEDSGIEIVTLRSRIEARLPEWDVASLPSTAAAAPRTRRLVRFGSKDLDVPVYDRPMLAPGQVLHGPAVLEQEDTTTWVLPDWSVRVHENGTLILEAENA